MNYDFSNHKLYISFTQDEYFLLKEMYETNFECFLQENPHYDDVERLGNLLKQYFNYDEPRKKLVLSNKRLVWNLEDFIVDYNSVESQFKFGEDTIEMIKETNKEFLETLENPDDYIKYVIKEELYQMWKFLYDYSEIRNNAIDNLPN